ncbi:MAG: heme-binding protein [Burkholderiales bacterium]|nr:heme-binding protein [Burkholderiales bacterium]
MRRLAAAAAVIAAGAAHAQGATWEARSLTPEAALKLASVALASCRSAGFQVTVAVTDRAALPLAVLRDRHAGPHTFQTAVDKAYTAITTRMDTTAFEQVTRATPGMSGIRGLPRIVAIGGGLPVSAAGSLVGAIGVSGAPGCDADERCAKAGLAAIAADLEF